MDLGLTERVAIVTGGSRGVGRACAAVLLCEGAKVVISGRDPDRLEKTRAALKEETGGEVLAVRADLLHDAAARDLVETTLNAFGRLDILVNSAATVSPGGFLQLTEADWVDIFEQKLNGYARCLRMRSRPCRLGRWGRIINLAGLAARQATATTVPVGLNNAAVLNLTKALAEALAPDNILVNAVVPHLLNTDRQDETMKGIAELTGKSEAEVRRERVGKIPLGSTRAARGGRRRGRLSGLGTGKLRHRRRMARGRGLCPWDLIGFPHTTASNTAGSGSTGRTQDSAGHIIEGRSSLWMQRNDWLFLPTILNSAPCPPRR